jgi:hypothetical protein
MVEPCEDPEVEPAIARVAELVGSFPVGEPDVVRHGECSTCAR